MSEQEQAAARDATSWAQSVSQLRVSKVPEGALNLIHRDISPHNVFLTIHDEVKVIDFGIAKAVTNQQSTGEGMLKGKVAYLAPEQMSATTIDRRVDLTQRLLA